jgi:hypothetical protein
MRSAASGTRSQSMSTRSSSGIASVYAKATDDFLAASQAEISAQRSLRAPYQWWASSTAARPGGTSLRSREISSA